jgi:hypothetical protein
MEPKIIEEMAVLYTAIMCKTLSTDTGIPDWYIAYDNYHRNIFFNDKSKVFKKLLKAAYDLYRVKDF